jgi:pectinesterase
MNAASLSVVWDHRSVSVCGSEKVHVPARKPFITIRGSGSGSTVVTWNARASDRGQSGGILGTYDSASVAIDSDYFVAKAITFQVFPLGRC